MKRIILELPVYELFYFYYECMHLCYVEYWVYDSPLAIDTHHAPSTTTT